MKWKVTCSGWMLLAPVWLADVESDAIVPISRPQWLWWWLECNFFLYRIINFIFAMIDPDSCGFMFYKVREVEPFEITV